jgi:hypothetical protein
MKKTDFFWLTNISERDVSLSDLNLTIRSFTSVNLLDKKHYKFTLNELQKSLETGSLYKKRDKIVKRKVPPESVMNVKLIINNNSVIPSKARSALEIQNEYYEEEILDENLSDEKFAEDSANLEILETSK